MSKTLIEFYYQTGIYDLNKMIQLVKEEQITEKDFFNITRLDYKALIRKEKGV